MSEEKTRYLVRMTTLRGVFYMCGSVMEGTLGWTTSDLNSTVTRYQILHAAKRAAQIKWNELNRLFDPLAIEVITPAGETVWQADTNKIAAQPWRAKAVQP